VGRIYASRSGEREAVAQAIFEHYLPRSAHDDLPESRIGYVVGLVDRLDTLVGLFAAGHKPSGARDPFALRRSAIGLIQLLVRNNQRVDLRELLTVAAEIQPIEATRDHVDACLVFLTTRQQTLLLEKYPHDAVEAVLAGQGYDPTSAASAVDQLVKWRQRKDWPLLLQAYARCVRITRDQTQQYEVDPKLLNEPAEQALHQAIQSLASHTDDPGSFDAFMNKIEVLLPTITTFFDDVLVMAEDDRIRRNRLGLLQQISNLAHGVADLSFLEGF
jgi:glycyl-tRNA synthetase